MFKMYVGGNTAQEVMWWAVQWQGPHTQGQL